MSDDTSAKRTPPQGQRFEKGKSGNPKGRPKGARNLAGLLKKALDDTTTNKDGKEISKLEAAAKQLADNAAAGDQGMLKVLLAELRRIEPARAEPHDCMAVVRTQMEGAHERVLAKLARLREGFEEDTARRRERREPCPTCGVPMAPEEESPAESTA
jgi:hypothetical protein